MTQKNSKKVVKLCTVGSSCGNIVQYFWSDIGTIHHISIFFFVDFPLFLYVEDFLLAQIHTYISIPSIASFFSKVNSVESISELFAIERRYHCAPRPPVHLARTASIYRERIDIFDIANYKTRRTYSMGI